MDGGLLRRTSAGGLVARLIEARLVRIVAAMALCICTGAVAVAGSVTPAASAPGTRWIDPVFDEVTITRDLVYTNATDCTGANVALALDVYEPVGDVAPLRPLYLWIHGGSFGIGGKAEALETITATDFAKRGYVAVSIDYRLCDDLSGQVINDAYVDARAAVAFMRANAAQFRIDPTRVAVAGASAGAITAMQVGYTPDRTAGEGTDADQAHADAVLSMAGAWLPGLVQTGEPSLFMAHGTEDPLIPFARAQEFCVAAEAASVACEFHSYPAGHESLVAYLADIEASASAWLFGTLDLASLPTSVEPPTSTTPPTSAPTGAPAANAVVADPALTG